MLEQLNIDMRLRSNPTDNTHTQHIHTGHMTGHNTKGRTWCKHTFSWAKIRNIHTADDKKYTHLPTLRGQYITWDNNKARGKSR